MLCWSCSSESKLRRAMLFTDGELRGGLSRCASAPVVKKWMESPAGWFQACCNLWGPYATYYFFLLPANTNSGGLFLTLLSPKNIVNSMRGSLSQQALVGQTNPELHSAIESAKLQEAHKEHLFTSLLQAGRLSIQAFFSRGRSQLWRKKRWLPDHPSNKKREASVRSPVDGNIGNRGGSKCHGARHLDFRTGWNRRRRRCAWSSGYSGHRTARAHSGWTGRRIEPRQDQQFRRISALDHCGTVSKTAAANLLCFSAQHHSSFLFRSTPPTATELPSGELWRSEWASARHFKAVYWRLGQKICLSKIYRDFTYGNIDFVPSFGMIILVTLIGSYPHCRYAQNQKNK